MKEYLLAILLESKEPGEEFGRWPLHITLVPWFQPKISVDEFSKLLQELLDTFQTFTVKVGDKKQFGHRTVHIIDSHPLQTLHNNLLQLVLDNSNDITPMSYTAENYQPHITQKLNASVQKGFYVKIKKVYLIESPKKKPIDRIKSVVSIGELK